MHKKSQITIIIAVCIIILVVAVIFFMTFKGANEIKTGKSLQKVLDSGLDLNQIQTYGDKCVEKVLINGIDRLVSKHYYMSIGEDIHTRFKNDLKDSLNSYFEDCIGNDFFNNLGYDLYLGNPSVRSVVISDNVTAVVDYRIEATYKNSSGVIDSFYARTGDPFNGLIDCMQNIISNSQSHSTCPAPSICIEFDPALCTTLVPNCKVHTYYNATLTVIHESRNLTFTVYGPSAPFFQGACP